MDLYIYDRAAGLLGVLDATSSIRWRRKYFEPGEVEIHLPATKENLELLAEGNIIRRIDRKETAIIEGVAIQDDDLTITGRMLSAVLERAILSTRYTLRTTYEKAMLALVTEAARVVPEVVDGQEKGFTDKVELQATYKNLLTVEERLAKAAGLGFRLLFAPGVFTFEVYRGVDRSVEQTENPRVIFSDEFRNLASPTYTKTAVDYKNKAYVAGEGEGLDRVVVEVDLSAGEDVRELFVDAKDIQREEGTTEEEYAALLYQRGMEKLAECQKVECFEGEGENVGNFIYLEDWDLGDIVTVQYARLGISRSERVTEVEEVYENGVVSITPTLGTNLPETLDLGDDTE